MHNDCEYYTGYAPIVNEFFDITSDQERSAEIIPFLRKITNEERELIGDAVKKHDLAVRIDRETPFKGDWHTEEGRERRDREIMEEIEKQCGYIPRFLKHDRNITRAFRLARYVCFSRGQMKDVEWNWYTFPISGELKEMMEWYIPEWFADYVKELRNKRNLQLTYSEILHWRRLGLLDSVPQGEIASSIPSYFRKPENMDTASYIHEKIDKYPEILDEIKYLFQYPSGAYYVDSGNYAQKKFENKGPLSYIFKHYSDEGKLDRQWIIREAVNACGNNFEKEQLYWYPVLLQAMEPTKDELMANQEGLITNLTSVFPQISLAMLKLLRSIADDSRFMIDHFIGHLTGLFSSETKTLVKATLSVVTDLLKIYPDKRNALCEQLAIIFIHKNEELQTKTAKLIVKYGDKEGLKPVLASYNETLLMSAKEILKDFLGEDTPPSTSKMEEEPAISRPIVRDDNRVAEIDSVEELVFRLGQAFEDFRLDSIDLIPQALIRFNQEIDGEVLQQFSPAIKGAEKVLTKWMRGKHFTDEITAFYFLYYCSIRLQQLDQEDKTVKQVAKRFGKLQPVMDEWVKELMKDDQNVPFTPYIDTLNMFLKIVQDKLDLPLLSTPTHEPCWIDPMVFLERFNRYKELQEIPAMFDMQLAIQRLALDHPEEALKQFGIRKEEKAFYPELFTYLFDRNKPLPEKIEHPDLWLACTVPWYGREIPERLAEHYADADPSLLTGKFEWEPFQKEFKNQKYNYDLGKYEEIPYTLPRLAFNYRNLPIEALKDKYFIGAYMWTGFTYYSHHFITDIPALLRMFPNNPEVLLARYICGYAQALDDDYDLWLIPVLELLRDLNRPLLPMGSLYLALCLLYQGKTTRLYAAEIWADLTASSLIDQKETGTALGRLLQNGHGPLQRFIDNLFDVMLNRSAHHNRGLEQLIAACLAQLGEKPLPRLKRLLEGYKELLAQNDSKTDVSAIPSFSAWEKEKSLQKITKDIRGYQK